MKHNAKLPFVDPPSPANPPSTSSSTSSSNIGGKILGRELERFLTYDSDLHFVVLLPLAGKDKHKIRMHQIDSLR